MLRCVGLKGTRFLHWIKLFSKAARGSYAGLDILGPWVTRIHLAKYQQLPRGFVKSALCFRNNYSASLYYGMASLL